MSTDGNQQITSEAQYEWGIRYRDEYGNIQEKWGYSEDPRTNGFIEKEPPFTWIYLLDEGWADCPVLAVGKRVKPSIIWELSECNHEECCSHCR